jgi:chaperonin GroES
MAKLTYQPLEDRLLVRVEKKSDFDKTPSGIIIPDTAKKDVSYGTVFSVGPGRYATETGALMPTVLAPGDFILYGSHQGMEITVSNENGENEEMRLIRESDVLMLEKKEP